ncbi:hypothetical protein WQ56_10115 [Luteimonas sp. FCS-9]|nr:hypothetical protein WQ56_10115 [Luteimonas sp. FCS-9]
MTASVEASGRPGRGGIGLDAVPRDPEAGTRPPLPADARTTARAVRSGSRGFESGASRPLRCCASETRRWQCCSTGVRAAPWPCSSPACACGG